MVKVRKKKSNDSISDISLLIEKSEEILQWDDEDLIHSIMEEVEIAESTARHVAEKVKVKIKEVSDTMGWESVPTSLIREFVSNEIIAGGKRYKKKVQKYSEIGLSAKEIETMIEGVGNGENSNISSHNPEAINFNLAEVIARKYAFQEVFSDEVTRAHMDGDIHVHDSSQIFKNYAFSKSFKVRIKNGCVLSEVSLEELWKMFVNTEAVIDGTQSAKIVDGYDIQILDRGEYVPLKKIVFHDETKDMVDFITGCGHFSVTVDHGCIVERDGEIIITRADDVKKSDCFISPS